MIDLIVHMNDNSHANYLKSRVVNNHMADLVSHIIEYAHMHA